MLKKSDAIKYRATDSKGRPVSSGFFISDVHAVGAFKEELAPGIYNIYKGKDDEFVRSIYISREVVEVCPECSAEVVLDWDVEEDGYEVYCPHCGVRMMLCDECTHAWDNQKHKCDWCETGCWRKERRLNNV